MNIDHVNYFSFSSIVMSYDTRYNNILILECSAENFCGYGVKMRSEIGHKDSE